MPGEVVDTPNPSPAPSHLPDQTLDLAIKPDEKRLDENDARSLRDFQQAACFLAGCESTATLAAPYRIADAQTAMIFLRDNVLVERDLQHQDVKPRLLGHWGTCPGLVLIWSHLNLLIRNHDLDMIFVIGPGHGAPAALAALWLEGSLERFYPDKYALDKKGLQNLVTGFSVPGGFPR